jgi:hypothetical protein
LCQWWLISSHKKAKKYRVPPMINTDRRRYRLMKSLNNYLTSVKTTRLRSFGEYFLSCKRSGVFRLFLEVK